MARTLNEIAPEAEIYALDIGLNDDDIRLENMAKAIDWAISNNLDILSHSGGMIADINRRSKLNELVNKAARNNIITTFIHCDSENNIWPYPFFNSNDMNSMRRNPDCRIFGYDYSQLNKMQLDGFKRSMMARMLPDSGNNMPFFSVSSTAPVLAGFIAILKSINNKLSLAEYKEIFYQTGFTYNFDGFLPFEKGSYNSTINIGAAASYLKNK